MVVSHPHDIRGQRAKRQKVRPVNPSSVRLSWELFPRTDISIDSRAGEHRFGGRWL